MGSGLYSITTRASGITLTSAIYMADHQVHLTNSNLDMHDDHSSTLTEMRAVSDPYPGAVAAQATSAAGELEQVRYQLAAILGETYWYIDPDIDLTKVVVQHNADGTHKSITIPASGTITFGAGGGSVVVTHSAGQLTIGGIVAVTVNYGSSFQGNANGAGISYSVLDIRNANATKDANTVALGVGLTGAADMTNAFYINFYDSDGVTTGNISAASGTTVAYNTSSDARLKQDVADFTGALDLLARVQPRTFRWKKDGHADRGFLAQELRDVYPFAVTGDPNDPVPRMGIDYGKLTPLLAAALKELQARFDAYVQAHP